MSGVYNKVTLYMYKDWNKHYADNPNTKDLWKDQESYVEEQLERLSRKEFLESISNAIDDLLDERRSVE